MKKTLIALALVSLPVAAMADVTLYGQLKGGVDFKQTKVGGHKDGTNTNVADYGSRVGFKGFEDLGNGLKAIWQVEQKVSLAGNTGEGWSNRETFVGLTGNFGTVRVGNLRNYLDSNMDSVDGWEYSDSVLGLNTFTRHSERVGQAIRYDSPEFSGFSASVMYKGSDDNNGENNGQNTFGNVDAAEYGVGLGYNYGPYFANYGFLLGKNSYDKTNANGSKEGKDSQVHRLEAGYDANNLMVAVGYEYGKGVESFRDSFITGVNTPAVPGAAAAVKSHQVAVTGEYTMGNLTPRVTYAHGFKEKDADTGDKIANSAYNQVIVGADYALSKRTTALVSAGWGKVGKDDNKVEQTAASVGLRHKF